MNLDECKQKFCESFNFSPEKLFCVDHGRYLAEYTNKNEGKIVAKMVDGQYQPYKTYDRQ